MPLVRIKPGLSHAHYSAGDEFDASPAEVESFGDKFVLVVEDEPKPVRVVTSWTEIVATPAARRLAQEHGLSPLLSNIIGTGKNGTITKADVRAMLNGNA